MGCVLQVEDNETERLLLQAAFEQLGSPTVLRSVSNSDEAMEYLRGEGKFADRQAYPWPSVVLLDLNMPGMSGLDLLRWIRSQPQFQSTAAILLTGSNHPKDVSEAYRLGANSCVLKPSEFPTLLEIVRALDSWWLRLNLSSNR